MQYAKGICNLKIPDPVGDDIWEARWGIIWQLGAGKKEPVHK